VLGFKCITPLLHRLIIEGFQQPAEKHSMRATQKDLRGEAREKSTSGGVLRQYVGARRVSATKHMSLFQQPAQKVITDLMLVPWCIRSKA
jgi:hypothetical protein